MKQLRGSNNSSNRFDNAILSRYYDDYEVCVYCHKAGADCYDHVEPRSEPHTNSHFNASPTHNQTCNIAKHGEMHTTESKRRMIHTNIHRLLSTHNGTHMFPYEVTEADQLFCEAYPDTAGEALQEVLREV